MADIGMPVDTSLSQLLGQQGVNNPVAASANGGGLFSWFPNLLGFGGSNGGATPSIGANAPPSAGNWGTTALGIVQGLGNAYMGMKQYGLAKDTLRMNKDQFEKNYAAQRQTTNASLEDRQRARVASNAGAYQSVGDYMNTYGIR